MNACHRVLTAALLVLTSVPSIAFERPRHVFTGRICVSTKGRSEFFAGERPCDHPFAGVVVTFHNSQGRVVEVKSAPDGTYAIDPIPMFGTDGDSVKFAAPDYVALTIIQVTFAADTPLGAGVGLTVFLAKQREIKEKVTVY